MDENSKKLTPAPAVQVELTTPSIPESTLRPPTNSEPQEVPSKTGKSDSKNSFVLKDFMPLFSAIIALIGGYILFRPKPYAGIYCTPTEGTAPLTVKMRSECQYQTKVVWEMGDGSSRRYDEGEFTYEYKNPGQYTIKLTALGNTSDATTQTITVRESKSIASPRRVKVIALTKADRIVQSKTFTVDLMKDDHPVVFASHGGDRSQTFQADSGFRFVESSIRFERGSAGHAGRENILLAPDKLSVTIRCHLESGPQVDRYRSWLGGTLIINQEKVVPQNEIVITPELQIDRFIKYSFPQSFDLQSLNSISVQEFGTGTIIATGDPTGRLISQDGKLAFSFSNSSGLLAMDVEPSK